MIRYALLAVILLMASAQVQATDEPVARLLSAASEQIGVTLYYDGSYQRMAFPNGDVALERGVCTDVVIRAYRKLGFDLQALVNQDMRRAWSEYPKLWRMKGPDSNIDHRRVPNLAAYFKRHGETLVIDSNPLSFQAGDIVTWRLPSGVPHIGLVADKQSAAGTPLVIHNIGLGTRMDDMLFAFTITGHFRYFPQ